MFLVGVLAVQFREEFGIDPAGLGWLAASFGAGGALSAIAAGRLSERLGPSRSLRVGVVATAGAMLAIAAAARSQIALASMLAVSGAAYSVVQAATSLYLARVIDRRRLGFAFGIRQSTVLASTLVAGLAVPTIALTVGWRWIFVVSGVAAVASLRLVHDSPTNERALELRGRAAPKALLILAAGGGLAAGGTTSISTFLVDAATQANVSNGVAALLVAVGSVLGLITRFVSGVRADVRDGGNLRVVIRMLVIAAVIYAVLAVDSKTIFVIAAPFAYMSAWGWSALFHLAVVRSSPGAPASATGVVQTGTQLGTLIGQVVLGYVARDASYAVAWVVAGSMLMMAALTISAARRVLIRGIEEARIAPLGGDLDE